MSELLTKEEFLKAMKQLNQKIDAVITGGKGKYVPRTEIIKEIGRRDYEKGVKKGFLNPVKNSEGRNSKARVERKEYEYYKSTLKR